MIRINNAVEDTKACFRGMIGEVMDISKAGVIVRFYIPFQENELDVIEKR